jgi:hypothetical protein
MLKQNQCGLKTRITNFPRYDQDSNVQIPQFFYYYFLGVGLSPLRTSATD